MNVEGHTDSIGTDDYNLKLSQRRADSVRDYLTSNGINSLNVISIGLGKTDPVASNDTAAGRQQNRRVEMVVSGDVIGQPIQEAPRRQRTVALTAYGQVARAAACPSFNIRSSVVRRVASWIGFANPGSSPENCA